MSLTDLMTERDAGFLIITKPYGVRALEKRERQVTKGKRKREGEEQTNIQADRRVGGCLMDRQKGSSGGGGGGRGGGGKGGLGLGGPLFSLFLARRDSG